MVHHQVGFKSRPRNFGGQQLDARDAGRNGAFGKRDHALAQFGLQRGPARDQDRLVEAANRAIHIGRKQWPLASLG